MGRVDSASQLQNSFSQCETIASSVDSVDDRSAAPKEISTGRIYTGVVPFIVLQIVAILVIWFMPALATAVPRWLFG